jgi:hypothetical protein
VPDSGPTFDPETSSVCFYVNVRGMRVKSFVTRDWLVSHYGPDVPADERMVETYVAHARTIDGEIARRVAAGRLEPVWLASRFPPAA